MRRMVPSLAAEIAMSPTPPERGRNGTMFGKAAWWMRYQPNAVSNDSGSVDCAIRARAFALRLASSSTSKGSGVAPPRGALVGAQQRCQAHLPPLLPPPSHVALSFGLSGKAPCQEGCAAEPGLNHLHASWDSMHRYLRLLNSTANAMHSPAVRGVRRAPIGVARSPECEVTPPPAGRGHRSSRSLAARSEASACRGAAVVVMHAPWGDPPQAVPDAWHS